MSAPNIVGESGGLYTGPMEYARQLGNPDLTAGSGIQDMGKAQAGQTPAATPDLANAIGVLQQRWPNPLPRSVQLAFTPASAQAHDFPPSANIEFQCGLIDNDGNPGAAIAYLSAVIEYGCGSAAQKLYCDWKPGAINLPASDFVSVSAFFWGDPTLVPDSLFVQAAVSTHTVDGTHVPTASGLVTLAANATRLFQVPAAARAVGLIVSNADTAQPLVTLTGSAYAYFDYANHVFVPSSAVVEVLSNGFVAVTSSLDCEAVLTWYLQA